MIAKYNCTNYDMLDFIVKNNLGSPCINTSGAVIYASAAKISFYIKGRKEMFFFKNKTTQISEHS